MGFKNSGKADKATATLTYGNVVYTLEFDKPTISDFKVEQEAVITGCDGGWVTYGPGLTDGEVHLRGIAVTTRTVFDPDARVASLAARAKKYGSLLGLGHTPDQINAIPEALFNEMALGCEPEPVVMDMQSPSDDEMGRLLKLLRKHIRSQGGDTASVGVKP